MKVLMVFPNIQMSNLLPTSIGLIVALLKNVGIEVKVFDTTFYKMREKSHDEERTEAGQYKSPANLPYKTTNVIEDFQKMVLEYKPDVIGVSVTEPTYKLACSLASSIDHKGIHMIFGGIYPTFSPDQVINLPYVDSLCIGEGEGAMTELCVNLRDGISIDNIKNLWIKKADGSIIKNERRKLVNLDELPNEDFTDFESTRFLRPMQGKDYRMAPIMIDRGCPYTCSFCAAPKLIELYKPKECYFRKKSTKAIIKNILNFMNVYNPNYIYFNTETFFARSDEELEDLAEMYKKYINLPFCAQTRVDTVTDKRVKLIKDMGCDRLSFGLEHGNEEFRKKILNKHYTNEQAKQTFQILSDNKIPVTVFNMLGFPDETRKLVFDTIDFNKSLYEKYKADFTIAVSIFKPYRTTNLRDYCLKKNYINDSFVGGTLNDPGIDMPLFTAEEVKGLTRTFVMYVMLDKSLYPDIQKAEKFTTEGNHYFKIMRDRMYST